MGCFDAAITLVYKAEKLFGDFVGDGKKLKEICAFVDEVAEESGADSIDVVVDEVRGRLLLGFTAEDVIIDKCNHPFVKLCDMVNNVRFSKNSDQLRVTFVLCGLWSGVNE